MGSSEAFKLRGFESAFFTRFSSTSASRALNDFLSSLSTYMCSFSSSTSSRASGHEFLTYFTSLVSPSFVNLRTFSVNWTFCSNGDTCRILEMLWHFKLYITYRKGYVSNPEFPYINVDCLVKVYFKFKKLLSTTLYTFRSDSIS